MRQILTLLLIFCSSSGFANLYIQPGTNFSFESQLAIFKLPNFQLQNISFVDLEAELVILYQLEIHNGTPKLSKKLTLKHATALVLGKVSRIDTISELLDYNTLAKESAPLLLNLTLTKLFKYKIPDRFMPHPSVEYTLRTSNYRTLFFKGYDTYFKYSTPPPDNNSSNLALSAYRPILVIC
jgi:hypothetical protein